MDFMNRGNRQVQQNTQPAEPATGLGTKINTPNNASKSTSLKDKNKLTRIGYIAFVVALAILLIAVLSSILLNKGTSNGEAGFVDNSKYQAVFLNGGQVYFGNIDDLNSKYLNLSDIYYLRVNQQVQPDQQSANDANDVSLVKLGCELHGPQDSMVINREQVIFWENLKEDGQVAKAIAEYVKANPDGQKCDQQNATNNSGANTKATSGATQTTTPATNAPAANTNNAANSNR